MSNSFILIYLSQISARLYRVQMNQSSSVISGDIQGNEVSL